MTTTNPLTMTPMTDLAMRIDDEGLAAVVPSLRAEGRELASLASRTGLSSTLADALTATDLSDVLWLRAYVELRAGLARLDGVLELAA